MPAARPAAAGRGGAHKVKSTGPRRSPHARAYAHGKANPAAPFAPQWVDTSDLQDSWLQGQADYTDDDDETKPPAPPKTPRAAAPAPAPEPAPAPAPKSPPNPKSDGSGSSGASGGSRQWTSSGGGDVAGAILGFIGVAFITNVVKGTWTDWLRAKFLNETGGTTNDPNAAPGFFSGTNAAKAAAAANSVTTTNPDLTTPTGRLDSNANSGNQSSLSQLNLPPLEPVPAPIVAPPGP